MKFTKTEIDLCRQIAEIERKEISPGDWAIPKYGRIPWAIGKNLFNIKSKEFHKRINNPELFKIPLWTIEDCLEFLRGKFHVLALRADDKFECELYLENHSCSGVGKTPLEALLKAVLAVLEEGK